MKKVITTIMVVAILAMSVMTFVGCKGDADELVRTAYTIDATLNVENMTVSAKEVVNYYNSGDGAVQEVVFNLAPAAFREDVKYAAVDESTESEAYPNGVDYGGITISSVTMSGEVCEWSVGGEDMNTLTVNTGEVVPSASVTLEIAFELDVPNVRHRFGYYNNVINLGNWYPVVAVRENGEWRTDPYYSTGDPFYSEVSDYSVNITAPTGWIVAGTGSVTTEINGENTTTKFKAENVRDFALSASDKFTSKEMEQNGVTIRYYYTSDSEADTRLELAAKAVSTFSELFGNYAYDCLNIIRTPFLYGGMEYPQSVYVSDALNSELFNEAMIHEIAHQWWYAAVGNDQIYDAWMDEGLAEYSTTLFYEHNPELGISATDRIADAMQSYVLFNELYAEQTGGVTSMNRGLGEYTSQIDYSFHSYVKGELLFDSLRHTVGDDDFFNALKKYYSDYSGKIAQPDDLIGCFESTSNFALEDYFASWIEGTVGLH